MPFARAVLDTNILLRALIVRGNWPDRLYRAWLDGAFELVTSDAQVAELVRVLARPEIVDLIEARDAARLVENIRSRAIFVRDPPEVDFSPDPDDNPILAAAIAGEADLIVSADKRHMLALREVAGIPIVDAGEALERLDAA